VGPPTRAKGSIVVYEWGRNFFLMSLATFFEWACQQAVSPPVHAKVGIDVSKWAFTMLSIANRKNVIYLDLAS
jgi:hypothetical protein